MKRQLKIEPEGDFRHDAKLASKIRLKGRWLRVAGFPPGGSVTVEIVSAGVLQIRVAEKTE
jgi:hypothetical protein